MDDESRIEAFSDLSEQDFQDLIASHYEGLDVSDVADALEDGEFGGVDEREIASFIADALDVSAGEVLELFEDVADGDGGGDDGGDESAEDVSMERLAEGQDRIVELLERLVESDDSGGEGDGAGTGEEDESGRSRQVETPSNTQSEGGVDLSAIRREVAGN